MDLRQLRYFLQVVEQGSFSRAARQLDLSQPALSRQVRQLEVEVHHSLLARNGRGVAVTDAGEVLRRRAMRILHEVELAHEELGQLRKSHAGHVRVGLPTSVARLLTAPLVREFREQLPGASLSISDGLSGPLHESLLSGQLDIALLYRPQPCAEVETLKVLDEELFLVGRAPMPGQEGPISLREVARLPLVIPRRPHEIRLLVEAAMGAIRAKPNVAIEVDGVPAILDVLANTDTYAILPIYAVALHSKSQVCSLRKIVDPGVFSMLALATSARRPATPTQAAAFAIIDRMCRSVLIEAIDSKVREFLDTLETAGA
jgi:LysR family nitrogen assimilation transcriptional regulator